MIRILHISDTHAQLETMSRVQRLAMSEPNWDVAALTGDFVSKTDKQVPAEWNEWPQRMKLSVPGNHDKKDTFDLLDPDKWTLRTPFVRPLEDLMFIGLGSKVSGSIIEKLLGDAAWNHVEGVVLLYHFHPDTLLDKGSADVLLHFVGERRLLILHGHDHPRTAPLGDWDPSATLIVKTYFRSRVCSSGRTRRDRGYCHLIEWKEKSFNRPGVRADGA